MKRDAQWQATHAELLSTATSLLRSQGIARTSVADVMAGAGRTKGTFYAHFASKAELFDEVIATAGPPMWSKLLAGIADLPEAERLPAVMRRYLSSHHRDNPADGCPLPSILTDIGSQCPEHAPTLSRALSMFVDQLCDAVFGAHGDAQRKEAFGVVSTMVGGLVMARALRGTERSDAVLRDVRAWGLS
jgi:TetR/AcrR family transcriptional regulator, transcriptional repressor for nem operon